MYTPGRQRLECSGHYYGFGGRGTEIALDCERVIPQLNTPQYILDLPISIFKYILATSPRPIHFRIIHSPQTIDYHSIIKVKVDAEISARGALFPSSKGRGRLPFNGVVQGANDWEAMYGALRKFTTQCRGRLSLHGSVASSNAAWLDSIDWTSVVHRAEATFVGVGLCNMPCKASYCFSVDLSISSWLVPFEFFSLWKWAEMDRRMGFHIPRCVALFNH